MRPLLAILFAVLLVGSQSACGNSCEELAKKRCECEPSENEQLACTRRVEDEASSVSVSDSQQEVCEALLDECTCEKLRQGDLAACGLAEEANR